MDPERLAAGIVAEIRTLSVRNTPSIRAVRRKVSKSVRAEPGRDVIRLALSLAAKGHRWVGYELIANHSGAREALTLRDVERLGRGMATWDQVDTFSIYVSGPAWRTGRIASRDILRWAKSKDRWWRRAALVSTVPLNIRSQGGSGDAGRTLQVCRVLAADPDDMVEKALSWALRSLVPVDRRGVESFLREHDAALGARVKREVRNKLRTGLKNPRKTASK